MADTIAENVPAAIRGEDKLDFIPVAREESATALDTLFEKARAADDGNPLEPAGDADTAPPIVGGSAGAGIAPPIVAAPAPVVKPAPTKADVPPVKADALPVKADAPTKKDEFDDLVLPPHTKPKTTESFDIIKKLAREKISARENQIAELNKKLEVATKATADELAKVTKELEDLRGWKKSVDVENDPSFKEFDAKQQKNIDHVLAKLKDAGFSDVDIAEIKKHDAKIVWDDIWTHFEQNKDVAAKLRVPVSTLRRYVEAKLVENETISDQKREALEDAKKNAGKFLKERDDRAAASQKTYSDTLVKNVQTTLAQFPWATETKIPDNASPEQKTQLEAQNAFAREAQGRVQKVIDDSTPETHADLIVGTVAAYFFKAQAEYAEKLLTETSEKVKTLTEELDKIKKASGAFRRPSNAPVRAANTTKDNLFQRGEEALDNLKNELMHE